MLCAISSFNRGNTKTSLETVTPRNWKLNTPVKKAERSRGLVKTKFLNYVSLAFPVDHKVKNVYPSVMLHTCMH